MADDPRKDSFLLLLNSFVLSMTGFLITPNWLLLFLFWELLGITSFFLISFYLSKLSTLKSGLKAFCFNRLSDSMILFILFKYNIINSSIFFLSENLFYSLSLKA